MSTEYLISGLAAYGGEIGVATQGNPYIISGVDPDSMTMQKVEGAYPCLSKRSVISVGDGMLYSSNYGLVYVGSSGIKMFTEQHYTRDEWVKLNPASMVCEYANGGVYCSYTTALGETAILVFLGGMLVSVGVKAYDLYVDTASAELYISDNEGIWQYAPFDTYPMPASWRSKEVVIPTPCNLGAAKVDLEVAIDPVQLADLQAQRTTAIAANNALKASGGFFGAMNFSGYNELGVNGSTAYYVPPIPPSNDVSFVLRNRDSVVFQRVISDNKAFRLPAGKKYDSVSVEVSGQGIIYRVLLAETMEGLKQA